MAKIKVKKEMNLVELIEHILENDIKEQIFEIYDNGHWCRAVDVNKFGRINFEYGENGKFTLDDLFTVTVEEEVTKETEIPKLLEVYDSYIEDDVDSSIFKNESIANRHDADSVAFHLVNPDGTTTLLWTKERGMVE